jgi:hypothetical protein
MSICKVQGGYSYTYHSDRQCAGCDAVDNLVDLVGVNTEPVKGTRRGELDMCLG